MKSDSVSVTINAKPKTVYDFVADLNNWPQFSDFAPRVTNSGDYWTIHSPQGDVKLITKFNKELMLLDTIVSVAGSDVLIPYRVVPNEDGSELIMTNFKAPNDTDEAYAEQVKWMKIELENIKKILEASHE